MHTILLIEDAPEYQAMVKRLFGHYKVIVTDDVDKVISILDAGKIDLILLDITLPKRDGYSVLQEVQAHPGHKEVPVICLTGKSAVTDKVTAFSLGADDYVQKPFDPMEFRARVEGKLSKIARKKHEEELLSLGDIMVDLTSHRVYVAQTDTDIVLTQTEYKILHYLGRRPGQVFSREQLLQSVWGDEGAVFDRAVDVHVCALRKKLGPQGITFKSVPGVGYKLEIANQSQKKAS